MNTAEPSHSEAGQVQPGRWERLLSTTKLVAAVLVTTAVLVVLVWFPIDLGEKSEAGTAKAAPVVKLVGDHTVSIERGSSIEKKLTPAYVTTQRISAPVLTVTASIVAHLRQGGEPLENRWQFINHELLSAYADWRKTCAEVEFADTQFETVKKLSKAQEEAQAKVVERLEKLVAAGTDSPKDLAAEKAQLLRNKLQHQKEEYEAQTELRTALRTRSEMERELFQAGADPILLQRAGEEAALVLADVPEGKMSFVREGQACEVRFYGLPGLMIPGKVGSVSPALSKERRTLRVFVELTDTDGRLKPGMFAEVALGTEPRKLLLVPADAVLHVGKSEYVLVGGKQNQWEITEVKVGETYGTNVEILDGLSSGHTILGAGAILLKPIVVQAVQK